MHTKILPSSPICRWEDVDNPLELESQVAMEAYSGSWEPAAGPLQELKALVTTEPRLMPPGLVCWWFWHAVSLAEPETSKSS